MDSHTNTFTDGNAMQTPGSTTSASTTETFRTNSNIGQIMNSDSNDNNNNNNNNDYAEITTVFARTMQESALRQIQRELEEQLNRLKNLNNKEFLAEMEVLKKNLNLSDTQMVEILLMTLRKVPIRHRNCPCGCYIHIKQKYNNYCLFTSVTSPISNTTSNMSHDNNNNYGSISNDCQQTPPTPEAITSSKTVKHPSFRSLFDNISANMDTPQGTDIKSILESEEMDYKLEAARNGITDETTHSTSVANYRQYRTPNTDNTKMYIDTCGITENGQKTESFCLQVFYKIREILFFVIPFLHTFLSSIIAFIMILEIFTDSYNENDVYCKVCHQVHDIFYGPKVHDILLNETQFELMSLYLILILRITTMLCWYILLLHTLLFNNSISCSGCCGYCGYQYCCCDISDNTANYTHYNLMKDANKHQQRKRTKYEPHQNTTILMNCSLSISEHLRMKSRTITPVNIIKFYLRMVIVPNIVAIILHILLFDEFVTFNDTSRYNINFYLNICVLFGFYWTLSEWFYFERENVLVSWRDVFLVFIIDLITNWIKLLSETFNFVLFLILSISMFIPLTIFVLLRIIFCPCFFGYNNASACLICNLFETFIEFILKVIKTCYI